MRKWLSAILLAVSGDRYCFSLEFTTPTLLAALRAANSAASIWENYSWDIAFCLPHSNEAKWGAVFRAIDLMECEDLLILCCAGKCAHKSMMAKKNQTIYGNWDQKIFGAPIFCLRENKGRWVFNKNRTRNRGDLRAETNWASFWGMICWPAREKKR